MASHEHLPFHFLDLELLQFLWGFLLLLLCRTAIAVLVVLVGIVGIVAADDCD